MLLRLCCVLVCVAAAAARLRGLNPELLPQYPEPSASTWTCLDGSATIRPAQVNDDVCDCADGSDEPGTSACPNGKFFCENEGFEPAQLSSSRVDDSVCDCCDGSDEHLVQCPNSCEELGRLQRERLEVERTLQSLGFAKRQELAAQGAALHTQWLERIATLEDEQARAREAEAALKANVEAAEAPESVAKETFDKEWEALTAQQREQEETALFELLDVDKNGHLTVDDLTHHTRFDTDQDGTVAVEEAEIILDVDGDGALNETEGLVDLAAFRSHVYPGLPEHAKSEAALTKPDYPDDVKALIEAANAARDAKSKNEEQLRGLEQELGDLQRKAQVEDGPNHEWSALADQCFEITDREYKYKLCVFDEVTQEPLHGGRNTQLGQWREWSGKPEKYREMYFDNGERCWNGPSRSMRVTVSCGAETKIHGVEEPSRCEYAMQMVTPAVCDPPKGHDEL